jgi:isoleucyl-tRNA synthetase
MAKQKGGNLYGALWTGTAFFAASKAKTYVDFLKSFAMYSVVVIAIMVAGWFIASALGLVKREGFVDGAFGQCTNGGVVVEENGQKVCKTDKSTVVMTE